MAFLVFKILSVIFIKKLLKNLPFLSMVYIDTYKWHSYIEKWVAYTFLCVAIVVNPHAKYIIILL